jgi:curli biogenesis system outer membrane secretion channel CsgG
MKRISTVFGLAVLLAWLVSCAPTATVTSGTETSITEAQAQPYDGPKARLAVSDFEDKTAKGGGGTGWLTMFGMDFREIGDGMQDMLTTALVNSNRFMVVERAKLDAVLKEQDLGASGRVKKGTEAPVGEIYGAELIVTAAVTEFEGSAKGVGGGTRILGINIAGGVKKAHIAIDLRVVDAKTSQILSATTVVGDATSFAAGGYTNIGGDLPVGLGGFSKTPVEKAIRICIQKAVDYIASKTPAEYYRHK